MMHWFAPLPPPKAKCPNFTGPNESINEGFEGLHTLLSKSVHNAYSNSAKILQAWVLKRERFPLSATKHGATSWHCHPMTSSKKDKSVCWQARRLSVRRESIPPQAKWSVTDIGILIAAWKRSGTQPCKSLGCVDKGPINEIGNGLHRPGGQDIPVKAVISSLGWLYTMDCAGKKASTLWSVSTGQEDANIT